jgi:rubrerythrin
MRVKTRRTRKTFVITMAVIFGATGLLAAASSATLKNLQSAYDGESNARARYLAFAKKAEAQGYGAVASLFRAAARAEEIHLENHAAVIRAMGAEPHARVKAVVAGPTKTNLVKSASKGEAYERDTMYPRFIRQAQAEGNEAAVRSFEYAREAEAGHFELFTAAAGDLHKSDRRDYFVCKESGYTMAKLDAAKCGKQGYETVN